jgi:uncharacterized protein
MKWRRGGKTPDVIDQRGASRGGMGGIPIGRGAGGLGLVGILLYILIQVLSNGGGGFNAGPSLGPGTQAPGAQPGAEGIPASKDPDKDLKDFSAYVFTNVQTNWEKTFAADGKSYEHAKLVLYSGGVNTACGSASSAVGPFYCPPDQRVYLDLSFYKQMAEQLGARGDFAWAYVIAHEMGHHVQNMLGTSERVRGLQQERPGDANQLSVRLELQADCYAGVWATTVFAKGDLEEGDLDEAFGAAEAVGDDRLQRRSSGTVNPDSFTHGTSEQRKKWFNAGYKSGKPDDCDTFSVDKP